MAMNKQRRTSNINNVVTYDTLNNVTIPASFTVKGLMTAGFAKVDANGLFSVDTTVYQAALPSQSGNNGKFLTTNGSVLSWGTVSTANIYTDNGTLTGNRTVTMGGNSLTFTGAGNVGIGGSPNASYKLDVTGTARVTGETLFDSTLKFSTDEIYLYNPSSTRRNVVITPNFGLQTFTGTTNVYIGAVGSILPTASNVVAIGGVGNIPGGNSMVIGGQTTTAASGSILLSTGTNGNAASNSIVLQTNHNVSFYATQVRTLASGQFATNCREWYVGSVNGFTGVDANANNGSINGEGSSGTDKTGGILTIAGGKGTGTGASGDVIFATATPTTTGTTLQALTDRVWIKGSTGNVGIGASPNASYKLDVTGASRFTSTVTLGNGLIDIPTSDFVATVSSISGNRNVQIGLFSGVIFTGSRNVAIGSNTISAAANNSITVGSNNTNIGGMIFGQSCNVSNGGYAIGINAFSNIANSFVIGTQFGTSSSASGQFVVEAADWYIRNPALAEQNGPNGSINGTGASGTDFAGGNITIAGGKGTGAGISGDVIISTATPIATGTTAQTLTNRVWVKGGGTNVGIGSSPNAINSLQVGVANQWSGAFVGNMAGNRTPSHAYGIHLGWNYTGGSGEANILWGTGGGGTNPYLTFSSWDGTTKVDRLEIQDTGKIVFKQYLATTSFTGTAVGYIAFDNTGGLITVPVPTSTNLYNNNGTLSGNRTVGTATGFKLTFNPNVEVITTTYNVISTITGWSSVSGYVQTTIPASTSFSATGYGFSSLIGNNYMTYEGSATFAADTFTAGILGINNFAFTAAASTVTITQAIGGGIRTYSGGLYQNTISGSVNGTITHLSGLAVRPIYRTTGSSTVTISNNYGLLINNQNEYSVATITKRWGVYQEGSADNNYFAGKVIIGTNDTVGSSVLNVKGLPTSAAGLSTGDVWNNLGMLAIV